MRRVAWAVPASFRDTRDARGRRRRRAAHRAPAFVDPPGYARHRPETTLLDQLVEQH
jgi:hypothetical protein